MTKVGAVVGATGVVGREMLRTLEARHFPAKEVRALASARSVGTRLPFRGGEIEVGLGGPAGLQGGGRERAPFRGVAIALSRPGAAASCDLAPAAAARGAVVIDNSSAGRMDP